MSLPEPTPLTTDNDDLELLQPGVEVGGRYVIERLLGRGGFSYVYLARHLSIETLRVAIKVMRSDLAEAESARRRFVREGEAVASLSSPHVVKVSDAGLLTDNRPYLVLEFCDGNTLDHLLEQRGRIEPLDVARFARQILLALEEAHRVGIVHRDLKPENVFVIRDPHTGERVLKVGDFGIARVSDGRAAAPARMTMSGGIVCTPAYASPELLEGDAVPASDLYALGHMMAELIDGVAPYAHVGQALVVCAEHLRPGPVPLGERTRRSPLRGIVERAVAKPLANRFGNARQMREALEALLAEWPQGAEDVSGDATRSAQPPRSPPGTDDTIVAPGAARRPSGGHDTAFAATIDIAGAGATPVTLLPVLRPRRRGLFAALLASGVLASAGVGLGVLAQRGEPDAGDAGDTRDERAATARRASSRSTDDASGEGSAAALRVDDAAVQADHDAALPGDDAGLGSGAATNDDAAGSPGPEAPSPNSAAMGETDAAAAQEDTGAARRSTHTDEHPVPARRATSAAAGDSTDASPATRTAPSDTSSAEPTGAGAAAPDEPDEQTADGTGSSGGASTGGTDPTAAEGTGTTSPFNNIRVR